MGTVSSKFGLLLDLGEVTVPDDPRLSTFFRKNRARFFFWDRGITDSNFSSPTHILKPGDKLEVRAFGQVVPGMTTTGERLEFCQKQGGGVFVGAQGMSLVFEQKRDHLPRGFWYSSFDQRERLWRDNSNCYRVPNLAALLGGEFDFDLDCFERQWGNEDAFLLFYDLSG